MKLFSTIILFSFLFICACRHNTDSSSNKSNACFCDSIFDNTHSDTIKEFLCYKGKHVYKLQQWKNRQSLSRHSSNDKRWLYENLECSIDNSILLNEYQYFLSIESINDSVAVTYVTNPIDSMKIIFEHNGDTIISNTYLTNKATFDKRLFNDSINFISVYGYTHDSLPHPETKIIGLVVSENSIISSTVYLLNNPLDRVLVKFRQCIVANKLK